MDYGAYVQTVIRQIATDHSNHGHKDMGNSTMGEMVNNATGMVKNATMPNRPNHSDVGASSMHTMNHAMSPYLFGNKKDFFVLFNEAKVTSSGGLAIAIVVSFIFALLATMFSEYSKLLEGGAARNKQRISGLLIASTVTFALRIFLHYVAMLIVMTMNVWLIIAVVVGHGVGHFLFQVSFQRKPVEAACEC